MVTIETTPVKTGQLSKIGFHKDLMIVVSDPRIVDTDPDKASKRIDAGVLRPNVHNWDIETAITAITDIYPSDYVSLKNVPEEGVVITDYLLKQDDLLLVISLDPVVMLQPILSGVRKGILRKVDNAMSPFTAITNMDILVDVSNGPVTIILPLLKTENDRVCIFPYKGRYEVNNLHITSTDMIHGLVDDIVVDVDNMTLKAVWSGDAEGWLIFGK